jgi:hypothetical protein
VQLTDSHTNYGQISYALELEIVDRVPHHPGYFLVWYCSGVQHTTPHTGGTGTQPEVGGRARNLVDGSPKSW